MSGLTGQEKRASRAKAIRGAVEPIDDTVMMVGNMRCNAEQATRLINAAGWDVANRRMREAGRTSWSRADYNAACRFTTKVFKQMGLAP